MIKNKMIKKIIEKINPPKKKTFLFVFLFLLLVPFLSEAVIGTGVFDLFSAKLEGISEIVSPVADFTIYILIGLIFAGLALHLSVYLLEMATDPGNLEILGSEMVQVGWQFTSSLANMAIIVVLIVIGIATVLNRSNYHAKKTLPKVILVALFVNFSLVIVAAIVDVSHIILSTFYEADIGYQITDAIFQSWDNVFSNMIMYVTGMIVTFMIPFIAAVGQFAMVTGLTAAFLPQLIEAIMQIITSFLIAGTLFTYAFLFFARIFIVQILAVLSPLAFVAWAIPDGKKYWEKWKKYLIQWVFLGIVLFFFLLLATIATEPLRPDSPGGLAGGESPFTGYATISSLFIYYITLAVFLAVAAKISKDMMPQGAQAIIDGVTSVKDRFKKVGSGPAERLKRDLAYGATQESLKRKQEQAEDAGAYERLGLKTQMMAGRALRRGMHAAGKTPEGITERARRDESAKHKGKTEEELKSAEKRARTYHEKPISDELKRAQSKKIKEKNDQELKSAIKNKDFSEEMTTKALETAIERGMDLSGLEDTIKNSIGSLDRNMRKSLFKLRPDLHEDPEDLVNNMSSGDVNKIKFSNMKNNPEGRVKVIKSLMKNTQMIKAAGNKSTADKKAVLEGLADLKKSDLRAGIRAKSRFTDTLTDPQERSKWMGCGVKNI